MRDARDPTRPTPVTQQPGSKKAVLESQGTPKTWPPGSQKELLGEPGVPQERHTEAASHPEPMGLVTVAPFLAIFSQNGLQNGGPFFRKFAERVVLRWLKTIPQAKNLENKGYRKGSRFGTSFGTSFGWNLS